MRRWQVVKIFRAECRSVGGAGAAPQADVVREPPRTGSDPRGVQRGGIIGAGGPRTQVLQPGGVLHLRRQRRIIDVGERLGDDVPPSWLRFTENFALVLMSGPTRSRSRFRTPALAASPLARFPAR